MIALSHRDQTRLDLVFGVGVIGGEVRSKIRRGTHPVVESTLPFSWDPEQQGPDLQRLERFVQEQHPARWLSAGPPRLNVIWTAGRGGFDLDAKAFAAERASFQNVVEFAAELTERTGFHVAFHMASSAGGLFEGQVAVSPTSTPSPLRRYGTLKLEQEQYLRSATRLAEKHIYRPSTIYGFSGFDKRMGLIARMIWGKMDRKVTSIFVSLQTIRDYLFVGDVARYICAQLSLRAVPSQPCSTHLLASGKPTTIAELIRIVDRVVPGRSYVNLQHRDFNRENNSFLPSLLPDGLQPTDLETGIRTVYSQMICRGRW
jgi:UDP-glucose 4-epimerase